MRKENPTPKRELKRSGRRYYCRAVLMLFLILVVSTGAHAQPGAWDKVLYVRISTGSLRQALETLERSSNTKFVYSLQDIEGKEIEAVKIYDGQPMSKILDDLLSTRGLSYKYTDGRIAIKKYNPAAVGTIQGTVSDPRTKEPLIGATVRIEGTTTGAVVDAQGNFVLRNVPEETYNLIVSFVGYKTRRIPGITVTEGKTSRVDVAMEEDTQSLQEVEVKGDIDVRYAPVKNSTEETLISDIRLSNNIVTGVSNVQITRSLDRDAADIMRRVPGVTVLNNFVLVRGMDPRYSATYLNDMLVPSTESDSRAFSFNLIPSGLIDGINIYKLPAPELPGGFGGGVIKVNTKKNQAARRIQVGLSGQYRTGGSSFNDYYTGSSDSNKDWLGLGLKSRAMPDKFHDPTYSLPDMKMYPQERMAEIRALPPVNKIKKTEHTLDRRFSLSYYDSWKIGSLRLNNLTALGYTYQRDSDRITRADRGTKGGRADFEAVDSVYTEQVRLSLLQHLTLSINENHNLNFNLFANRNTEDNTLLTAESLGDGNVPLNPGEPAPARKAAFEYRVRDLVAAQLSGDHQFRNHRLHWFAGRTRQIDEVPDWQIFSFVRTNTGANPSLDSPLYNLDISVNKSNNVPRQYWYTAEKINTGGIDYSVDVLPFLTLKTGTLLQWIDRHFDNYNYTFVIPLANINDDVRDAYRNQYNPWFTITDIFNKDEYFKDDGTGFNLLSSFSAESYSYTHHISAAYLAGRFNLIKEKLELYGGLRYENEYAQLFDADGAKVRGRGFVEQNPVTGQPERVYHAIAGPDFEYFLPSANLTWSIDKKHKVRAGFGRTLDRPAYRERSTSRFYSIRDGINYDGNVLLQNAQLDNYDLRWEWYPTSSEFIAAGAYYKFIEKPIEVYEFGYGNWSRLSRSWRNNKWAELYGVEVEIRKNLSFLPFRFANRFSMILNASYIYTQVRSDIEVEPNMTVAMRLSRPLTGSSPYVLNANLYYESPKNKTVLALSYNYMGERLIATSPSFVGDLYEKEQHLFDVVILYPLGKYVKLKAGVQNMLNKDMIRWRDGNLDGEYTPGQFKDARELVSPTLADNTDYEGQRWNPGSYYSLGLTLTF